MTVRCECRKAHHRQAIVLTGGPGAGKTAVLEVLRQALCEHVAILPEAAGIVFGGGFPRRDAPGARRAAQRAIFRVQLELEAVAEAEGVGITLCDRGAVDGSAYWPGPDELWAAVGTSREEVLARYDTVIHLRVPGDGQGYDHANPLRVESAREARRIDDRIHAAWEGHPRRFVVESTAEFLDKVRRTLGILHQVLPECCREHAARALRTAGNSGHLPAP